MLSPAKANVPSQFVEINQHKEGTQEELEGGSNAAGSNAKY